MQVNLKNRFLPLHISIIIEVFHSNCFPQSMHALQKNVSPILLPALKALNILRVRATARKTLNLAHVDVIRKQKRS